MTDAQNALYQRRLASLARRIERLTTLDNRYTWVRLGLVLIGCFLTLVVLGLDPSALGVPALITAILFAFMVYQHRRIRQMQRRFQLWSQLQSEQNARANLHWSKLAPAQPPLPEPEHPFDADLDLTGDHSLHQLLDTCVALESSLRLHDRLLTSPSDAKLVASRQALVRELVPLTHFCNRLTLSARSVLGSKRHWQAKHLLSWIEQPTPTRSLRRTLVIAALLALCDLILFVLNQTNVLPPYWAVSFILYAALILYAERQTSETFEQITSLQDALTALVHIFRRLETSRFVDKPALTQLCSVFHTGERPSVQLRRANLLVTAAGVQTNMIVSTILNALLPWDLFIAYQLERYQRELAAQVPGWLDAWFELETASALATFASLNPGYVFPTVSENTIFHASNLGHPLIPSAKRVCNDFAFDHLGEVALITGSNMSGKSSFLRTLGVNLCLAYAGAPVCADSFDTGLFRLFTSIHVSDSLAEGFSYFYAEVRRLQVLLAALEADDPRPLFFLIDEIFRGTNNQERLIGSRSYLRALMHKHGVGIIATHDLELTSLPGPLNYHFEDQVVEGQMSFDYRLRSGPSPTTNALKIMRLAGLPVEE